MPEQSPRGLTDGTVEPRFLVIGRVTKPHGVRGEVRVDPHTELPERFGWLDSLYIGLDDPKEIGIEGVRFHKNWVLLKLSGIDSREAAQALRSQWLQIPEDEGLPLDQGQYYLYQVLDLPVYRDDGLYLGTVTEILETKANNVYVVQGEFGEILLPDIDDVILDVDFEHQRITVHLLPGMMDEEQ